MFGSLHRFVGRTRELAALRAALGDAQGGRGSLWMLCGEPGIGKSRLAEEIAFAAMDAGLAVLWGRCWEAGGAPAYWPWIQILRELVHRVPKALTPARTTYLGQLMPELGQCAPSEPPPSRDEPTHARFQLLDAVAGTLLEAARHQPLLLIVDDLHSADRSSLTLLDFLARQIKSAPVMVLGTFRDAQAAHGDASEPLLRLAGEARTVPLGRLSRDEVAEYLRAVPSARASAQLVDAIHSRTEGNPLFLVELTRLLPADTPATGADAIPLSVRTAVRQRLGRLTAEAREVLGLASVVGREFYAGRLAEAFSRPLISLGAALDEAEGAAMLIAIGPGAYRFSHNLIREVVYSDVPEVERRALHHALAEALRSRFTGSANAPWSEIAHHFLAAGPDAAASAVEAAQRAAQRALGALAFAEAADFCQRALAALAEAAGGAPDQRRRARLLIAMGHAQMRAGERERGRAACIEAAAIARAEGAAELLAEAALELGSIMVFATVDDQLVALLEEALAGLGDRHDGMRARLQARLAAALQPAEDPGVPIAMARDAVALARQVGDRDALLVALRCAGSTMVDLAPPDLRLPFTREHIELARTLGARDDELRGHFRLVLDCFELGDIVGARAATEAARTIARSLGHPFYQWRVRALDATLALWEGRFADAEAATEDAHTLGEDSGDPNVHDTITYQRVRLLRLAGRRDKLAHAITAMSGLFPGTVTQAVAQVVTAAQWLQLGEHQRPPLPTLPASSYPFHDRSILESLAELGHAAGDRELAAGLVLRLATSESHFLSSGVIGMTWDGPCGRPLGLCYHTLGRLDAALRSFDQGIEATRARGGAPVVAWMSQEAAAMRVVRGTAADRDQALRQLDEAQALAEQLGMATVLERAEATRAQLGGALSARCDPAPTAAPAAPAAAASIEFTREGEYWTVADGQVSVRMRDSKGMRFLAELVGAPGRDLHALDLVQPDGGIDSGDAGELLDAQARAEYAARVSELRAELAEAEQQNDLGRAEKARAELEFVAAELSRAVGLGGRERRAGGAAERARVNVQRRLRDAIKRISAQEPRLGRRLERSVKTGVFCRYDPD
jgi:tetratricopeptide (TPR) repeat protein